MNNNKKDIITIHDETDELEYDEIQLLKNKLSTNNSVKFDLVRNIDRLLEQRKGDLSFYYLSIIGFIEGFLRDQYKIKFNKTKFNLIDKNNQLTKTFLSPSVALMLSALINEDDRFKYPNNDIPIEQKKLNSKFLKFMSHATGGCVDGNRIRHCFAEESAGGLAELVVEFIKFAQVFNFYDDNKKKLDKLLTDKQISNELRNLKFSSDIQQTLDENIKLSKDIQIFLENDPDFASKFTSTQIRSLIDDTSLSEEQVKFLLNYKHLQKNQAILSYYSSSWRDYQSLLSKLTDEQEKIRDFVSDVFKGKIKDKDQAKHLAILGGPGTGKTILLINILQNFVDEDIELLTYTDSLNKYNKYIASTINFSDIDLNDTVKDKLISKVKTFDSYILQKAELILDQKIYLVDYQKKEFSDSNSKKIIEFLNKITHSDQEQDLYPDALYKEALKEVWSNMPNEKDYCDKSYKNGKPIKDKATMEIRKKRWKHIEELQQFLDNNKDTIEIPYEYACYKLAKGKIQIPNSSKVDYLLIDEAQDLDNVRLHVISSLTRKNYVLAGDLAQSVFIEKGLSWNAFSDFVSKNLVKIHEINLKDNFRSTAPIQDLANTFLENEKFKIKGKEPKVYSESYKLGPLPTYLITKNNNEALEAIKEQIILMKEARLLANKDFCIIASNTKELEEIQTVLGNALPSCNMENKEFNFSDNDAIRLSTVKYVKGIDCSVVMLYLTSNYQNKKANGGLDLNGQYNGIYACITRAMDYLEIFISNTDNYLNVPNDKSSIKTLIEVLDKKAMNLKNLLKVQR